MRLPLALVLAVVVPLAGCASPDGALDAASLAPTSPAEMPWALATEGHVGWVAAVGEHVYFGDLIVGVRSHDQCPEVSFLVPPGASSLLLAVDDGPAPATLALSGPELVVYKSVPLEEGLFEEKRPNPGVWTLELKPVGAMANERRAFTLEVQGAGTTEPEPLVLQYDGDCIL